MDIEKKIHQEIICVKESMLASLKEIMKMKSVKGSPTEGAPFGQGPKAALEKMLMIAQELGFQTGMVQNAVGYAQLGNEEDYIGVIGHLDVVPEGKGWEYPPYDVTEKDGVLYGRGVLDNKGPLMSCLYALYILKEMDIPLKKTIRILFGTDEESGSQDIALYLQQEKPPVFGFTPDCKYPVVYAEKGYIDFTVTQKITDDSLSQILWISNEFHKSKVPSYIQIHLKNGKKIEVHGKASPSNAPELGENAITIASQQLLRLSGEVGNFFKWVNKHLHEQHFGEGFGFLQEKEEEQLILTPYAIELKEGQIHISIGLRYPIADTEEAVLEKFQKSLTENQVISKNRSLPSTVFPLNRPELMKMKSVYEQVTGLDGTPVTTTGATYARFMPNTVAFGPSFPGQKGIAHKANEWMNVEDLMKNLEIYTFILYELAK